MSIRATLQRRTTVTEQIVLGAVWATASVIGLAVAAWRLLR